MADVVFVRTRHVYDSYGEVIQLAQLSGFDLCYPDEIDAYDASKCYLILTRNGEFPAEGWTDARAKIWFWCLEWDEYPPLAGVTRTFSADKWFAAKIGADYLPMGSHRNLNCDPAATLPHEYDAALLAYLGPYRRGWLVNQLQQHVRIAPNAWNPERDSILRKSRSMLNIHQRDDAPCVAAQRFALAAAYRLPVITEALADAGLFDHTTVLSANYAELADCATAWLRGDARMLTEWGENLYELLCVENTFEKCVNAAI